MDRRAVQNPDDPVDIDCGAMSTTGQRLLVTCAYKVMEQYYARLDAPAMAAYLNQMASSKPRTVQTTSHMAQSVGNNLFRL